MGFRQHVSGAFVGMAMATACAAPSQAAVVYDTITGLSMDGGYAALGSSNIIFGPYSVSAGVQFTATESGYIDNLTLSVLGANIVQAFLYSDNGGKLGTQLQALTLDHTTTPNNFATGSYTSGVSLQQGQRYWVLAGVPSTSAMQRWNYLSFGTQRQNTEFRGYSDCCVTAVTTGTYTSGPYINGLGLKVSLASAVPEPTSWALMISGFGLAGAGLRRRRVVAAAQV